MNDRASEATEQLKKAKADGLSYHDATQRLGELGFSKDDIAQASYQFPYNAEAAESTISSSTSIDHAFAKGVVHQEAVDTKKKEATKSLALGFFGPWFPRQIFWY